MFEQLIETLKKYFFSIVIDETTDVSVEKKLAAMVQYYDVSRGRLVVELLDMICVADGTAKALTEATLSLMKNQNCDLNMLVGFSADTCNTMFGARNSVSVLLKAVVPQLLTVKCSCHSIHLSASKACLQLPKQLEDLVCGVYNYFAHSSKRRTELKEFQEYAECPQNFILKPGQTRWLSLQNAVRRLKEQLDPLKLFFVKEVEKNPKATTDLVLELLMDPLTKPYLEFMEYVLSTLNDFNTIFQSEVPLLHELKKSFNRLVKNFACNFMDADYVRQQNDAQHLDPQLSSKFVPLECTYVGELSVNFLSCYN